MNAADVPFSLVAAQASVPVVRHRGADATAGREEVAEETPVALVYNGVPFAVMLATPLDLEDFALGFSWTEGVIGDPSEFQGAEVVRESNGYSVYVSVPKSRSEALGGRRRAIAGRTGCGLCGAQMLEEAIRPAPRVRTTRPAGPGAIARALEDLAAGQALNAATGAVHAAAWADAEGRVRWVREDVGRHNALDKLIGVLAREAEDRSAGFAVVTSRASYELVYKSAVAGIPMLCAVSAPTAMAIRTAEAAGITLVGFAREGRHTVYHDARERI